MFLTRDTAFRTQLVLHPSTVEISCSLTHLLPACLKQCYVGVCTLLYGLLLRWLHGEVCVGKSSDGCLVAWLFMSVC